MSKNTFIIDFDSTLVTVESLDELAGIALKGRPDRDRIMAELRAITALGMSGEIGFGESLSRRLKLFGANKKHVEDVTALLRSRISPSALNHSQWFKKHLQHIYVVSGGFEDYIVPVVKQLGITVSHVFANRFIYDKDDNIVGYDQSRHTCQTSGKARQVEFLSLPKPIVAIGDGFTDYEIKARGIAHEFWAFTETSYREKVVGKADRVLESFIVT